MKLNTTANRDTTPPIIFVTCPGGGGHLWAKLNPRWYGPSRLNIHDTYWCHDHQEEKRAHIAASISKAQAEKNRQYAEMPPPPTRVCTNKAPTTHPPGAVLPSHSFYKKRGKLRSDGGRTPILDSQCKDCRRVYARERNAQISADNELRTRRRARNAKQRERDRKKRAKLRKQRDRRIPAQPFRDWIKQNYSWMDAKQIADRSGLDESTVRKLIDGSRRSTQLSTVDQIAVGLGWPGLIVSLYPLNEQEAA